MMQAQGSDVEIAATEEELNIEPEKAEEAYVIEGLPTTADITLIGSKSQLYIARQYSSLDITNIVNID